MLQLPTSYNGNQYAAVFLWTILPNGQKYSLVIVISQLRLLLDYYIVARHGVPEKLLSDVGQIFY